MTDVDVRMERLDLHDGDVVVVRFGSLNPDMTRSWAERLQSYLSEHGHPDVLFMALTDGATIECLSIADMAELGWQPASKAT